MELNVKTPRLKIVEQIAIVLFFAVVIPMTISAIIINNVNQQSVRGQLKYAAELIATVVSDDIDVFKNTTQNNMAQIAVGLKCFSTDDEKKRYLDDIVRTTSIYDKIFIINSEEQFNRIHEEGIARKKFVVKEPINNNQYLVAIMDVERLQNRLFSPISDTNDNRQVYILSHSGTLMAAFNYDDEVYKRSLALLPKEKELDTPMVFGDRKNQPFIYLMKTDPKVVIIVSTPPDVTKETIEYSRSKIIMSVLIAALTVLFTVGLYTYYLYINIRQLFKAIIAISKGNYRRRIRLLSSVFTPYEIIFLALEFNRMVKQINKSYLKLKKTNKELNDLNEFRSNMIDTVSHELRTPLTSIQGYTSRLLRQDIEIDKETQQKSLKIIKKQSERLKRMIEDLLVIPDIEDSRLNITMDTISIPEIVDDAILLVKNSSAKTITNNIPNDIPQIYADRDRFEQVVINLVENAVKYADDDTEIVLDSTVTENRVCIEVKNKCKQIGREKLNTLFDKFTRLDDSTTRTTRGTGLGLYIVKGLVEAMNGDVKLNSNEEYGFIVKIYFEKVVDVQSY